MCQSSALRVATKCGKGSQAWLNGGHQVGAKTPSVGERSLCECPYPLLPFFRRVCFEDGWIEAAWGGEVSSRTARVMCPVYAFAFAIRCATTSRTSQRAQALGLVQASGGKAVRYCFSRSDSVWMTLTSSACVDMVFPSLRLSGVPTGDIPLSASGHKPGCAPHMQGSCSIRRSSQRTPEREPAASNAGGEAGGSCLDTLVSWLG